MATNLLNRAQISYSYGGGEASSAVSNQTSTTLLDQYTMLVTKTTLKPELRAGSNAAYVVRIENNGAGTLSGITVEDNLGALLGGAPQLEYVEDSAAFYLNGSPVTGTAAASANGVTFSTTEQLEPGSNLIVIYLAQLSEAADATVTNTATVTANTGAAIQAVITETASATVTPVTFANVAIFKSADRDTVVEGDTLVYTFTLMNTGYEAAEAVTLTDAFPTEFSVGSVSLDIGGTETPVTPADYTVTGNTMTFPAAGSALTVSVPAATEAGPGVTVITVTGTIGNTAVIE